MKLEIENFNTLHPEIVIIELLQAKTDDGYVYSTSVGLVLDSVKNHILFLPTQILEDTKYHAVRKTLTGIMKLYKDVATVVPVIDLETGNYIDRLDMRTLFAEASFETDLEVPPGTLLQ